MCPSFHLFAHNLYIIWVVVLVHSLDTEARLEPAVGWLNSSSKYFLQFYSNIYDSSANTSSILRQVYCDKHKILAAGKLNFKDDIKRYLWFFIFNFLWNPGGCLQIWGEYTNIFLATWFFRFSSHFWGNLSFGMSFAQQRSISPHR